VKEWIIVRPMRLLNINTSLKRIFKTEQAQRVGDQTCAQVGAGRVDGTGPDIPLNVGEEKVKTSGQPMPPRTLQVVALQPSPTLRAEIVAARQPRRDYFMLQAALNSDMLYLNDARGSRTGRVIARLLGARAALVWAAFQRRHKYEAIYTEGEIIGLPLALLLKMSRTRAGKPRHVTLAHYLSPIKKRIFFRLGVGSRIDTLIVHAASQRALASDELHIPRERIVHLPYFVDTDFWQACALYPDGNKGHTSAADERALICAAGLELRDYPTLLAAIDGLAVDVHIAASSAPLMLRNAGHAHHGIEVHPSELPSNLSVHTGYDYATMRELYAASRFVVVPLREVDFQAGVTVVLEAMAMGKAVVVSGTRGQTDVVRDRRNGGRGRVAREWLPGFLDAVGLADTVGRLPTGLYVTPGDPQELRRAIKYLIDHPQVSEELGSNGRRVAEEYFSLEAFTGRFAAVIRGDPLPQEGVNLQVHVPTN
jgi:glycosyltransferase involved in cell wall biosynthesis